MSKHQLAARGIPVPRPIRAFVDGAGVPWLNYARVHHLEKAVQQEAVSPLFRVVGFYRAHCGVPRYFFQVKGQLRSYRAWELGNVPFLLDLHPDYEHWRSMFPRAYGRRIDTHAAHQWFVQECERAGVFDPPEEMKPRGSGRPRKMA